MPNQIAAHAPAESLLPLRRPGRGLVFILGALTVIGPFAIDMYLPALPVIGHELGVEMGAVQLTLSAFLLGIAVGQAFMGPVVDRFGRRSPLLVGLAVFVVACAGCALAHSMAALLAWRLVMALGASASMVVPRAVVRDFFNERDSARMYSLLMLILGVSPIFAPSVGGQLVGVTGWRGIFWLLGGLGLACAAAVAAALPDSAPKDAHEHGGVKLALRTYWRLLRDPRFIGATLVAGFTVGAVFCYLTGSAFVLIELHGLTPKQYALAFGFIGFGLIVASQANPLARRAICRGAGAVGGVGVEPGRGRGAGPDRRDRVGWIPGADGPAVSQPRGGGSDITEYCRGGDGAVWRRGRQCLGLAGDDSVRGGGGGGSAGRTLPRRHGATDDLRHRGLRAGQSDRLAVVGPEGRDKRAVGHARLMVTRRGAAYRDTEKIKTARPLGRAAFKPSLRSIEPKAGTDFGEQFRTDALGLDQVVEFRIRPTTHD